MSALDGLVAPAAPAGGADEGDAAAPVREGTVLVVDDDPLNVDVLAGLLGGFARVVPAYGGEDAVTAALDNTPDLVLLDVDMPDMDGYDVCRRLKDDPRTRAVPVIFVTARGGEEDETRGLELGAIDYIAKPIRPAIVSARVRNQLALKRQRDALERLSGELSIEVSQLIDAEKEITHLATHDALTGLPNRMLFLDRLDAAVAQTHRSKETLAVLFVDLDGFKAVNDTLGHAVGDALLKHVAAQVRGCVRETDTVARLGGDEFVVLLTGLSDNAAVETIAGAILERLAAPFETDGATARISGSIGIACSGLHGDDAESLLQNADAAMYAAKRGGKNAFAFAEPA
jgi:diguanylate cyclase (GGDEF)-like protein